MSDPDAGVSSYAYNNVGELVEQVDALRSLTSIRYDRLGRKVSWRSVAAGQASDPAAGYETRWVYDTCGNGRLCEVKPRGFDVNHVDNYARRFSYDRHGRVVESSLDIGIKVVSAGGSTAPTAAPVTTRTLTMRSAYDARGRLAVTAYPAGDAGTVGYTTMQRYNAAGYLDRISDTLGNTLWEGLSTYQDGQSHQSRIGGRYTTTRSYDTLARLAGLVTPGVQDLAYSFDHIGNLAARSSGIANLCEDFVYDMLNRLTKVRTGNGRANLDAASGQVSCGGSSAASERTFVYDDYGNLTNKAGLDQKYRANTHQLTSAQGQTYRYDDAGQLERINEELRAMWTPQRGQQPALRVRSTA
jgi:YD repeat-containing protein